MLTRRLVALVRGPWVMTLGLAATALSGAIFMGLAPRLTSRQEFAGLALAWTCSTLFGLGLAVPTEQFINRRSHATPSTGVGRAIPNLFVAGAVAAALVGIYSASSVKGGQGQLFFWATLTAVIGWLGTAWTRGTLLAGSRQRSYALSHLVESASRLVIAGCACVAGASAHLLLYAGVGVPLIVSTLWSAWASRPRELAALVSAVKGGVGEQASFTIVALGFQFCLSGPPILLGVTTDARLPQLIGAFGLASTLMRAPAVLAGGPTISALSDISGMGSQDRRRISSRCWLAHKQATGMALGACLITLGLAPVLLPAIYGGPLSLAPSTYVSLAGTTVLCVCATVMTTVLLAVGMGRVAALIWVCGASTLVILTTCLPQSVGILGPGLVAGPIVVIACSMVVMRAKFRIWVLPSFSASTVPRPGADHGREQRTPSERGRW